MKRFIFIFGFIFTAFVQETAAQAFYKNNDIAYDLRETKIVNMFPNPATNHATIVLNYVPLRQTVLDVVDFNGHIRRSFAFAPGGNQFSFDVGFLERGHYVVRIRESNRLIDVARLVKA